MHDNLISQVFIIGAAGSSSFTGTGSSVLAQDRAESSYGAEANADARAVWPRARGATANGEERPGAIVIFDSLVYGASYDCGHRSCLSPSIDSWVQPQTLAAYRLALGSKGLFPSGVVGPAPIILVSSVQLDSLRSETPSTGHTSKAIAKTIGFGRSAKVSSSVGKRLILERIDSARELIRHWFRSITRADSTATEWRACFSRRAGARGIRRTIS